MKLWNAANIHYRFFDEIAFCILATLPISAYFLHSEK